MSEEAERVSVPGDEDSASSRLGVFDAAAGIEALLRKAAKGGERYPLGYSYDVSHGQIGAGELGFILARTGVGKSTFVVNMLARTAEVPTVFFSLEMGPEQVFAWLVSCTFNLSIPAKEMESVLNPENEDPRMAEAVVACRRFAELYPHLWIVDPPRRAIPDFVSTVDAIWDDVGVRPLRVVIDHLTLMKDAQDYAGVGMTAMELHRWARGDRLAILCLQQSPRGAGDGKTRNDGHLPPKRASGVFAGEDAADWIWGLYQPALDPKYDTALAQMGAEYSKVRNVTKLNLVKNRATGEENHLGITLVYDPHSHRLTEAGETYEPPGMSTPVPR